jgi:hypothetical protein
MMSVNMLSVTIIYWYAECHYAKCCYAECRGAYKIHAQCNLARRAVGKFLPPPIPSFHQV